MQARDNVWRRMTGGSTIDDKSEAVDTDANSVQNFFLEKKGISQVLSSPLQFGVL